MDLFFFRNRLSAWLDGELPTAELRELEQAMATQPELQAEAAAFRKRVAGVRALRLPAPPEVLPAAMLAPAPVWHPPWWAAGLVCGGLLVAGVWLGRPAPIEPENPVTNSTATLGKVGDAPGSAEVGAGVAAGSEAPLAEAPAPGPEAVGPASPSASRSSRPSSKSHARMTVVIPKDIVEDPDATDYAEEDPLPNPAPVQSFRYRLVPTDPDTALKSLKDLVTHLGGQFLTPTGGAKATYPIDSGNVDRVLLKVSAANLPALVQNLSTTGTVRVVAQPSEVPPSGMVGVFVEVEVPPP